MSYTEIYKFKKDGSAIMFAETKNAFRGAMAIWDILDKKYLPPFFPEWAKSVGKADKQYYRSSDGTEGLKEVWALYDSGKISETDKIVLGTTFDNVIVMKEDLPKVIEAFRNFEGETSLKEQADILEQELKHGEFLAIAWNQTSVNAGVWQSNERDEDENYLPYNILTMNEHWNLFEPVAS